MCGIVGLYSKTPELENNLGSMVAAMLAQMSERGPDSAGFAIYRNQAPDGAVKITVQGDVDTDWKAIRRAVRQNVDAAAQLTPVATHAIITLSGDGGQAGHWIEDNIAGVRLTSIGNSIEIFKEKGLPQEVIDRFALDEMRGTHALGHTRMATESAVTTEHSHPFNSGLDLCLVHNGSLSNHNRLRTRLQAEGIRFQTDNDSEVAAGYLTWRLRQGASLKEALEYALRELDGFYTFAIGTRDGFAVLRDPIACKPAVIAETDDWVAMASEYRAIAQLPGHRAARVWEPEPATVYSWERHSEVRG